MADGSEGVIESGAFTNGKGCFFVVKVRALSKLSNAFVHRITAPTPFVNGFNVKKSRFKTLRCHHLLFAVVALWH